MFHRSPTSTPPLAPGELQEEEVLRRRLARGGRGSGDASGAGGATSLPMTIEDLTNALATNAAR